MVTITATDAVQSDFVGIAERAEIRNAAGDLIGYFEPSPEVVRLYQEARQHFNPEEVQRIKASKDSAITTAEMLEFLRSVAPEQ
jgi:predicted component of type VI protein secretion system